MSSPALRSRWTISTMSRRMHYPFVMRNESLLLDIDGCLVSANTTGLEDKKTRELEKRNTSHMSREHSKNNHSSRFSCFDFFI